jgi:uncharacterized protein with ACT and thioredoxin-like domain
MVKDKVLPIIKEYKDKNISLGNKENGTDFITTDGPIKVLNIEEEIDIFKFLNNIKDYEYIFDFEEEETIMNFYKKLIFIYYSNFEKESFKLLNNFFKFKKIEI